MLSQDDPTPKHNELVSRLRAVGEPMEPSLQRREILGIATELEDMAQAISDRHDAFRVEAFKDLDEGEGSLARDAAGKLLLADIRRLGLAGSEALRKALEAVICHDVEVAKALAEMRREIGKTAWPPPDELTMSAARIHGAAQALGILISEAVDARADDYLLAVAGLLEDTAEVHAGQVEEMGEAMSAAFLRARGAPGKD